MARKTISDLSGIANTIVRSGAAARQYDSGKSAPALSALQGELSAVRELNTDQVDDWGPSDRLDDFTAVNKDDDNDVFDALVNSIRENGQQVPVLVRRAAHSDGRFEIIYGRRRLQACRVLGLKVKANIVDLDDATAMLAKGLENAVRRGLSFYEKARFAQGIQEAGYDTQMVRKVLNVTPSGLSHLTRVTDHVPTSVGNLIGAAPKSGRPKWTALANAFVEKKVSTAFAESVLKKLDVELTSDQRLDALLHEIAQRTSSENRGEILRPLSGFLVRSTPTDISIKISKMGKNSEFSTWLEENINQVCKRMYDDFEADKHTK